LENEAENEQPTIKKELLSFFERCKKELSKQNDNKIYAFKPPSGKSLN
jgi:hypothetical protein